MCAALQAACDLLNLQAASTENKTLHLPRHVRQSSKPDTYLAFSQIEGALDSDDITPLVRLVFDAQHPNEPLPLPIPLDSESGTTTLEEAGAALRENPLESVLEALQEVAEDKEAEIQQICRQVAGGLQGVAIFWQVFRQSRKEQ